MKKKVSIFKNDPYGIKSKMFNKKLDMHIREGIKVNTNILRRLLLLSHNIGHPETEKERDLLKKVIQTYDETILKLEENLTYARMWTMEGGSEK